MPLINVTLPSDGTTADVGDYNSVITTMLATINGLLDDDNIASLNGNKIVTGTLPVTALDANAKKGWSSGTLPAPSSVTYNGNRSYSMVFNANDITDEVSPGMRLRTTRTVAGPVQCSTINGTNQYWSKSSPNKMTFTDDFVVSAWIKVNALPLTGNIAAIASRSDGTSGWTLWVTEYGQLVLNGRNGGASNFSRVISGQSIPLNRWVHVVAQLDMSSFTATASTSYIMMDGMDVPAVVSRSGTNPTALIQAGNLEIGRTDANNTYIFNGKVAQVAVFNAKVAQSTMVGYISQGLVGTETSLASAWSFNNSSTDLNTTTPNDLSANGSVVATTADSPFGAQSGGTFSTTLDYAIITAASFSTNTTLTVQVPEGCTIPTSGGVAAVAYSGDASPYGFPKQVDKWTILTVSFASTNSQFASIGVWTPLTNTPLKLLVPVGSWTVGYTCHPALSSSVAAARSGQFLLSAVVPNNSYANQDLSARLYQGASAGTAIWPVMKELDVNATSALVYQPYFYLYSASGVEQFDLNGTQGMTIFYARNGYL